MTGCSRFIQRCLFVYSLRSRKKHWWRRPEEDLCHKLDGEAGCRCSKVIDCVITRNPAASALAETELIYHASTDRERGKPETLPVHLGKQSFIHSLKIIQKLWEKYFSKEATLRKVSARYLPFLDLCVQMHSRKMPQRTTRTLQEYYEHSPSL